MSPPSALPFYTHTTGLDGWIYILTSTWEPPLWPCASAPCQGEEVIYFIMQATLSGVTWPFHITCSRARIGSWIMWSIYFPAANLIHPAKSQPFTPYTEKIYVDTYVSAAHTYWTGVLRSAPNFSTNCEVSADAPNTRDNTPFRLCFLLIDRSNRLASFRHHNGREGMVAFCVLPSYGLTLGLYCSFPCASCGLRHCLLHTNAMGQPQGAERVFGIRLPINLSIYASSVHTMYICRKGLLLSPRREENRLFTEMFIAMR